MNKKICRILPLLAIVGMLNSCACTEREEKFLSRKGVVSEVAVQKDFKEKTIIVPYKKVISTTKSPVIDKADTIWDKDFVRKLALVGGLSFGISFGVSFVGASLFHGRE